MSIINQRVIHDDNGTLTDNSAALSDAFSQPATVDIVAAEDKLYLGSELPFNHRYILMDTANTAPASISDIEIWDGNSWESAVDIIDQTQTGGATLGQSGLLSWALDRTGSWGLEDTTEDVTGLTTLKIYDLYWARLTFSADLDAGTAIKYIGHKFSDDEALAAEYPDLVASGVLTAFEAGKADWNEQHIVAAEKIISFMRAQRVIVSGDQLLDWAEFQAAAVHKVAEIIMNAFGEDFRPRRDDARKAYHEEMKQVFKNIDKSMDGRLDEFERLPSTITLVRR